MKYLIIATVLMSVSAHAAETCGPKEVRVVEEKQDVNTPAPKELEGATIIVKLKDGSFKEMKAEEFKVVPRKQQFKIKQRTVVQQAPCPTQSQPVIVEKTKVEKHKNIISLTMNRSLTDYDVSSNGPGSFRIENKYELAVGLMYQRNVYKDLYLGVQADTHKSLGLNAGLGF